MMFCLRSLDYTLIEGMPNGDAAVHTRKCMFEEQTKISAALESKDVIP